MGALDKIAELHRQSDAGPFCRECGTVFTPGEPVCPTRRLCDEAAHGPTGVYVLSASERDAARADAANLAATAMRYRDVATTDDIYEARLALDAALTAHGALVASRGA